MRARGSKTEEAAKREESNSSQRIERFEIVTDLDATIDAVIAAPTPSLTGGDGTFPLPVASGPTMCSVVAGQGAPSINGIPDAMMSQTESPGADGTLQVSIVNRPIRSSLEAGQGPPRIDETATVFSPTRRTPEDPEAGEVIARDTPTSTDVELLVEAINIVIGFLAIVMTLVSVLVFSYKLVEFAVLVLNLISWVTMLITFVAVAIHRGVEFQILLNERKLDCIEIFVATLQVVFDIICRCLKLSLRSINIVILVLSVGLFSLQMGRKYQRSIDNNNGRRQ